MAWKGKKDATRITSGPRIFIAHIKIVVRVAAPLMRQNAMVGILGGKLGDADAERGPLLHALEMKVDAVGVRFYHAPQVGLHIIFFAHSLLGPFLGKLVIGRIGVDLLPVHFAALAQDGLVDDATPMTSRKK